MKMLVYLLRLAIYSVIAFIICSPCISTWGFNVCLTISLLVGFTWGLLNEIRVQIMILIDLIKNKKG